MKEKIALILRLYEEGKSLSVIQNTLGVSNTEFNSLLKYIKDSGYNTIKQYSSDGEVIVKQNKTLNFKPNNSIRISVKGQILRAIFISDLHLGSEKDRPDLLKVVTNYAQKHDIHIIFNGGDLIEGVYKDNPKKLKNPTVLSQVKKAIRVHPYVPGIIYFNLYGNHDYKSLNDEGFDVARYIEERRFDMVSLGYGQCIIDLKDDAIAIAHDLKKGQARNLNILSKVSHCYYGGSHKSRNRENKVIYIPALSDKETFAYEYRPLAGFLDVEFIFQEKLISKVNIRQLSIVNNEICMANEETMILKKEYKNQKQHQKR